MQKSLVRGIVLNLLALIRQFDKLNARGIQELTDIGVVLSLESEGKEKKVIHFTCPETLVLLEFLKKES